MAADGSSLIYSTFLGGSGLDGNMGGLALDSEGNVVVASHTSSSNFPTTAGAYDTTHNGDHDVCVLKLAADGGTLLYSTFLGGSGLDLGFDLALDGAGNTVVTGYAGSGFPTTGGAYDTGHNGGRDAFVAKLSPAGDSLLYSTFLGGGADDEGWELALSSEGNTIVAGTTGSSGFPTTAGAYDTSHNGGWDAFVLKLSVDGDALSYSTFLGGSGTDYGQELALDSNGNAVVAGYTYSSGFPTTGGAYDTGHNGDSDLFVLKLSADGNALQYSTFLGGSAMEATGPLALDSAGNVLVTGLAASSDFPTTSGAYDSSHNGGLDVVVSRLSPDFSSLQYSTFVGGSSDDWPFAMALDGAGNAVVTGQTASSDFPTTIGAYDTGHNADFDVFVLRLDGLGDAPATYSISGQVTDGSGTAISGVSVSDGLGHTATTDSNGNFTLTDLPSGIYTLTPSRSGYTFSPASRSVTVPPDTKGQDFAAIREPSGVLLPVILRQPSGLPAPLTNLYVQNVTSGLVLHYTVHGTPEGDITCANIPAGDTVSCGSFTPGTYQASVDTVECGAISDQVTFTAGDVTRVVDCVEAPE